MWPSCMHLTHIPFVWITVHFAGYEFARCAIMALFTSDQTGFTSTSMITLATGLGSPFSLALLWVRASKSDRQLFAGIKRDTLAFCSHVSSNLVLAFFRRTDGSLTETGRGDLFFSAPPYTHSRWGRRAPCCGGARGTQKTMTITFISS